MARVDVRVTHSTNPSHRFDPVRLTYCSSSRPSKKEKQIRSPLHFCFEYPESTALFESKNLRFFINSEYFILHP